jgi:hypothetical protein
MAVLAAGLVLAALLGAGAVKSIRRSGDEIAVTGSFKESIVSDFAVWRLSLTSQRGTVQEAYADLQANSQRVRDFLRQNGVADSSLTVQPVQTEPVYRMLETGAQTGDVTGYRLTQRFEVRSSDVRGMTELSQRANGLISQGIPVVSPAPEYLYTKLAEKRTAMLAKATEDARSRADAIARAAGSGIGAVRSARMGVFQITPRNSTEVSDYGINDTSSLEKDITAVVRVTFSVE